MRRLLRIAQLAAVLSVLSCTGSDEHILNPPFVDYESWVLSEVNDTRLPALIRDDSFMRVMAISDTLVLREDGTGKRVSIQDQYQPGTSTNPTRVKRTEHFSWSQTGDEIRMDYLCNDTGACIAGPHLLGTVEGMSLTLSIDLGRVTPAEYLRLALL